MDFKLHIWLCIKTIIFAGFILLFLNVIYFNIKRILRKILVNKLLVYYVTMFKKKILKNFEN